MSTFLSNLDNAGKLTLNTILPLSSCQNTQNGDYQLKTRIIPFIPGSLKEDSPKDRLFFSLYQGGHVNQFAECLESKTWVEPDLFQECEIQEILSFLNRQIIVTCKDVESKVLASTITLFALLKHLNILTPGNIFLIGSHLQEIANKSHWSLNNLKKIIDVPIELFEKAASMKAGDSDWRIFPNSIIPLQTIFNLSNGVINYIAEAIFKDVKNQPDLINKPETYFFDRFEYVKKTSLLKFHCFNNTKENQKLNRETNTVYTTIAFGDQSGIPIDLMFIQQMEKPYLFSLDDYKLNMTHLINPSDKTIGIKQLPENDKGYNIWQQIVDQALYVLHSPNLEKCDEMGWFRALRHLSKGGRFFEINIDVKLFQKIILLKLPELSLKYFQKINQDDQSGLIALYFQLLKFMYKHGVDEKIIDDLKEKLSPLFKKEQEHSLWQLLLTAFQQKDIPFNIIYSALHATWFFHMATPSKKVVITRSGIEPVFEITESYSLQTSGNILTAIDILTDYFTTFKEKSAPAVKNLLQNLTPSESYTAEVNESLCTRLPLFGLEFNDNSKKTIKLIKKLLNSDCQDLQTYGYNFLLSCFPYIQNKQFALQAILSYFPQIFEYEKGQGKPKRICQSIMNILDKANLSSLKQVFLDYPIKENSTLSDYLNLLIQHMDFSSYPFVYEIWLENSFSPQEKKIYGIAILKKVKTYDVLSSLKLLNIVIQNSDFKAEGFVNIFKTLCKLSEVNCTLETLYLLKKTVIFLILQSEKENGDYQLEACINILENELKFIIKKFDEFGFKNDAKDLFSLGYEHSVLTIESTEFRNTFKEYLTPSQEFKSLIFNLEKELQEDKFQKAIITCKDILAIPEAQTKADILRDFFEVLFQKIGSTLIPNLYPILGEASFHSIFSCEFEKLCGYCCHYMESITTPGSETLKLLILLLSELENSVFLTENTTKQLFSCLLRYISNLNSEMTVSLKKLLRNKALVIIKLLRLHLQNGLLIDILSKLNTAKIEFTDNEEAIDLIAECVIDELKQTHETEKIYQLLLSLKLFKLPSSTHIEKIEYAHNLLLRRLLDCKLPNAAKSLLGLLIQVKEPCKEKFFIWMNLFALETDNFEIYNFMIEKLLEYVKDTFDEELMNKLTFIIKATENLTHTNCNDNGIFKIQLLTSIVGKLVTTKNLDYYLLALAFFQSAIDLKISHHIIENGLENQIEKLLILIVTESGKFAPKGSSPISTKFATLIISLVRTCPDVFNKFNISILMDNMLKSRVHSLNIVAGQTLFYLFFCLKKRAPVNYINCAIKFFNLIINDKTYFTEEHREIAQINTEVMIWSFVELDTFDLHFEESFKAKIIGKLSLIQLTKLQTSTEYKPIQIVLSQLIRHLPLLTRYPEIEYECLDLAFNILIPLIDSEYRAAVDLNLVNLLSGVSGKLVMKVETDDYHLEDIQNPERFFDYIVLFTKKLIKTDFKDPLSNQLAQNIIQRSFFVLFDIFKQIKNQNLQPENLEPTKELEKKKKRQLTDLLEQLMFCPIGHYSHLFTRHINVLQDIVKNAASLNVFEMKPKLRNTLEFYMDLDPLKLLQDPGKIPLHSFMEEVLGMIKCYLRINSSEMLVRAINIYKLTQDIQIVYIDKKKNTRYLADPQGLACCFKEIQSFLLIRPFHEVDLTDLNSAKRTDKLPEEDFIFGYFQIALIENMNILKILHSREWKNLFLEISTNWCQTLIKLFNKEKEFKMQGILLGALYGFMLSCNTLYCFKDNFTQYSLILKHFIKLFMVRVSKLIPHPELLKSLLNNMQIAILFDIRRPENVSNRDFGIIATAALKDLIKIPHSSIPDYVIEQIELLAGLRVYNQNDINQLLKYFNTSALKTHMIGL
jgi:hypothetical protein